MIVVQYDFGRCILFQTKFFAGFIPKLVTIGQDLGSLHTIHHNASVVGQDGQRITDFIGCQAWGKSADFISKYFRKGSMIVVSGRLQSRKWQDRDGNNRTNWEIVADNVYFGESRRDNESGSFGGYDNNRTGSSQQSGTPAQSPFSEVNDADSDGELPF